ncbi:UNKNOWN [Stylonychia lemnae]|uniref:Uncharacterized protein n=1 Tax=Stylonychia lemnae TaxID=5949 RepID=A0A078A8T1_STYLE|nr:UNKNOWN [Stylonychia lemnae]|eukprot:CDW78634.1 UNKNOWN [Stylonychia lemnae]
MKSKILQENTNRKELENSVYNFTYKFSQTLQHLNQQNKNPVKLPLSAKFKTLCDNNAMEFIDDFKNWILIPIENIIQHLTKEIQEKVVDYFSKFYKTLTAKEDKNEGKNKKTQDKNSKNENKDDKKEELDTIQTKYSTYVSNTIDEYQKGEKYKINWENLEIKFIEKLNLKSKYVSCNNEAPSQINQISSINKAQIKQSEKPNIPHKKGNDYQSNSIVKKKIKTFGEQICLPQNTQSLKNKVNSISLGKNLNNNDKKRNNTNNIRRQKIRKDQEIQQQNPINQLAGHPWNPIISINVGEKPSSPFNGPIDLSEGYLGQTITQQQSIRNSKEIAIKSGNGKRQNVKRIQSAVARTNMQLDKTNQQLTSQSKPKYTGRQSYFKIQQPNITQQNPTFPQRYPNFKVRQPYIKNIQPKYSLIQPSFASQPNNQNIQMDFITRYPDNTNRYLQFTSSQTSFNLPYYDPVKLQHFRTYKANAERRKSGLPNKALNYFLLSNDDIHRVQNKLQGKVKISPKKKKKKVDQIEHLLQTILNQKKN